MAARSRSPRWLLLPVALVAVVLTGPAPAGAAEAPVGLGVAESFAVLGGSTVTNTGPTVISGDLGVSPGSAVTGFPPGTVSNGSIHAADALAASAQAAVTTAFNDAAGRASTGAIAADLGGRTLVSGVYTGGAVGLTGTLTLDGQGDAGAVFIVRTASTLVTASGSNVALIGGAQACNVFWQVGSSATLGTGSTFNGTILAQTAITATTGVTVTGRLLTRTAAVTLDTNVVNRPTCAAAVPTTTTSSSSTTSTTSTTLATTTTTVRLPTATTVLPGGSTTSTVAVPAGGTGGGGPTGGVVTPVGDGDSSTGLEGDLPRTGLRLDLLVVAVGALGLGLLLVRAAPARVTGRHR